VRRGPVLLTVVISAALHVAFATGLVAVAQKREVHRRAISVAVQDAKKKEAQKPKPPPPPRPIAKPAAPKPAAAPAPVAAAAHVAHAAPVAMNLAMGNSGGGSGLDIGPGIGLHGRADAPPPAAATTKVASAISERRLGRAKEEDGGDAPCAEEPTKPEAVIKTEINYSVYPQAQQDGIEGKIKLRFTVSETGEVSQVDVVQGIDAGLDAAVVAAAKSWRFKPAMACGKPVAGGTYVVQIRFELGN
jgi:periplasmic protein TonB